MIDVRTVRARTPPRLWQVGSEAWDGLPEIDGPRANQGLSPAGRWANRKQEKIEVQIERQRRPTLSNAPGIIGKKQSVGSLMNSAWGKKTDLTKTISEDAEFSTGEEEAHRLRETRASRLMLEDVDDVDGPLFAARFEAQVEEFQIESGEIERKIQDMGRRIRLENFGSTEGGDELTREEEREKARREEIRREKDLEVRRARKREQMARDPHRKIEILLENSRRFGFEAGEAKIPMQSLEYQGVNGRERLSVVDVRVLRSRCHLLGQGATVQVLMDAQEKAERRNLMMQASTTSLGRSTSAPGGFEQSASTASSRRPATVSDDRLRTVHMQRATRRNDKILHRAYVMRGDIPDTLSDRFGFVDQAIRHRGHSDASENGDSLASTPRPCHKDSKVTDARRTSLLPPTDQRRASASSTRGSVDLSRRSSSKQRRSSASRPRRRGAGKFNLEEVESAVSAHRKSMRHWGQLRAAVAMIGVSEEVKVQSDAADTIKAFMKQFGEWSRIKSACGRMFRSIRKLQTYVRGFLRCKQSHLASLELLWQHYEDDFLSSYFKQYCRKLFDLEDDKTYANTDYNFAYTHEQRKSMRRELMRNSDYMDEILQWQRFRLPPKERHAILDQYYKAKRMQRVRLHDKLANIVNEIQDRAKTHTQDMSDFLAGLEIGGYRDESDTEDEANHGAKQDARTDDEKVSVHSTRSLKGSCFWELPRNVALALITLVTKSLIHVEPYQDHPINNDMLEKVLGVRTKATSVRKLKIPASMETAYARDRAVAAQAEVEVPACEDESCPVRGDDLEDVLQGFTPRRLAARSAEQELVDGDARRKSGGSLVQPPLIFELNSVKHRS